jgi:hypothetical protein
MSTESKAYYKERHRATIEDSSNGDENVQEN